MRLERGLGLDVINVLHGCKSFQGEVRSKEVIDADSFGEFFAHSAYRISEETGFGIELFSKDTIRSFDASVIGWFGRREDHERDVEFLAGSFKVSHELGASIDLDTEDRERTDILEFLKEESR